MTVDRQGPQAFMTGAPSQGGVVGMEARAMVHSTGGFLESCVGRGLRRAASVTQNPLRVGVGVAARRQYRLTNQGHGNRGRVHL